MAERNPVIPVTNRTANSESEVVSRPKKIEIVPVREEVHNPAVQDLTKEPLSEQTRVKTKEIVDPRVPSAQHPFRVARRKVSRPALSLIGNLRKFADERPLHFVAAIAGVAFIAGVALRILRSRL